MPAQLFDDLTDVYEAMIDWPKRLANEAPFFRRLFHQNEVRSVLDAACGTGRHAAMFHEWGLRVEGADLSPRMIERARAAFGTPPGLNWEVRGYDQPHAERQDTKFDAAVCVGNSLALAPDMAVARRAVWELLAAVRPGGVVVIQVLNLWRMEDGPCLWQRLKAATLSQGDVLILKGVHRCGTRGYVDLVLSQPSSGRLLHSESLPFLGLESSELDHMARQAGAAQVDLFGGYQEQPYDPAKSVDLIMVVRRS